MLEKLKQEVYEANMELVNKGVVIYTWGNVSGISDDRKYVVIKPSGVKYEEMKAEDMVVVSLETGKVVEGEKKPSTDTDTHLVLYRNYDSIKGVVHTHSTYAVSFAQAGINIPILGTTQADYFAGDVLCTRGLKKEEIETDYELNTGNVIVETINDNGADPVAIPGIIVKNHGPFTWGKSPADAVYNAVVLEKISEMNYLSLTLNPNADMSKDLLNKHYSRKHGPNKYYGQ